PPPRSTLSPYTTLFRSSAEWYEKRAQTQIQNHSEKAVEQTLSQLRERAREISSVLATELDHSSRNFLGHTQTQMEDVVRDSFERDRKSTRLNSSHVSIS